ncbi:ABC transporter permease subunit [Heliobacterium gestii]|uniref:ABC transporter permease subunit n=1 Tax=Heliomicrobium gestii TaxID=2699 RepID=A0A845LFF1_HELGE|nr:ABC transporter permease [Heliomicrobium gestii]MBM7865305.1 NitT/TauT family transport system permease protein [Heliomicrobium gestii]MZP41566.1 ABC transporter permease subunit [Heliomicrobium gestii]
MNGAGFHRYLLPTASLTLAILLWQLASGFYRPEQLPSPLSVLEGLIELAGTGALAEHIQVSLMRFGLSYTLAVLLGIPTGLLLGWSTRAFQAIDPIVQVLRPISPIAWFPLAVLWFGIGNPPAIFIIFLSAVFPIILTTTVAVRQVPLTYLKVAQNFGASRSMLFRKVVFPAAFPQIMTGLHIAVGTAWIHLVAGEMLGAQSGLGYLIVDARNFLRTDWIIAGMLIVGILGLLINRLMRWAEVRINRRWGVEGRHEG